MHWQRTHRLCACGRLRFCPHVLYLVFIVALSFLGGAALAHPEKEPLFSRGYLPPQFAGYDAVQGMASYGTAGAPVVDDPTAFKRFQIDRGRRLMRAMDVEPGERWHAMNAHLQTADLANGSIPVSFLHNPDADAIVIHPGTYDYLRVASVIVGVLFLAVVIWSVTLKHSVRLATTALALSEEKYRTLFEGTTDPIFIYNAWAEILMLNQAAARMVNASLDQSVGKHFSDFFPDMRRVTAERIKNTLRFGKPLQFEDTIDIGPRRATYVSIYQPVKGFGDGAAVQVVSHDVSGHKAMENALRKSEALLLEMGRVAKIGGWEHDLETGKATWTSEVYRIKEIPEDVPLPGLGSGRHLELYHPEDKPILADAYKRTVEDLEPFDLELRCTTASGRAFWCRVIGYPVVEDGRCVKVHGAFQDITQRKSAEIERNSGRERLRLAFKASNDGFWDWDVASQTVFYSPRWKEMLGYTADELADTFETYMDLLHEEDAERVRKEIRELEQNLDERFSFECRMRKKDGDYVDVLSRGLVIRDDDGTPKRWVGTHTDISERIRFEKEIWQAREYAEFANRAKTEFLLNMSHELRTPLTIINGSSEILSTQMFGPIENPKYLQYAESIKQAGDHLLRLISDLLDVSRIEMGNLALNDTNVDMGELLSGCLNLVRERAENAALRITLQDPGDLPMVVCDELRMKQVFLNIVTNAIKFTPDGGTVDIKAKRNGNNGLAVMIADTGIGIAPENLERVMENFGQVEGAYSRNYQGIGIGLALSKKLVELHGGAILLESDLGVGTRVTVTLPHERVVQS